MAKVVLDQVTREFGRTRAVDEVSLEVEDRGSGIAEAHLTRIFEPFFSTKGANGNGLGLAAVRSIVDQHAGHITVDSRRGEGTVFRIVLPVASEKRPRRTSTPPRVSHFGGGSQ